MNDCMRKSITWYRILFSPQKSNGRILFGMECMLDDISDEIDAIITYHNHTVNSTSIRHFIGTLAISTACHLIYKFAGNSSPRQTLGRHTKSIRQIQQWLTGFGKCCIKTRTNTKRHTLAAISKASIYKCPLILIYSIKCK